MNFYCWIYEFLSHPLVAGLLSAFFFTLGLTLLQLFRYWWYVHRKFHNVAYVGHRKGHPQEKIQEIRLFTKRNRIQFEVNRIGKSEKTTGEIVLNEINIKYGSGFHTKSGTEGFGFLKAVIKGRNTICIEMPFTKWVKDTNNDGKLVGVEFYQAFVWERKSISKI